MGIWWIGGGVVHIVKAKLCYPMKDLAYMTLHVVFSEEFLSYNSCICFRTNGVLLKLAFTTCAWPESACYYPTPQMDKKSDGGVFGRNPAHARSFYLDIFEMRRGYREMCLSIRNVRLQLLLYAC